MSPKPDENSLYEQQENKILQQSDAFISLLTKRGILGDHEIDNTRVRNAQQKRRRTAFHNTQVLLQHYRSFKWILEISGICLLSFAVSIAGIFLYVSGNPMANEDITQIMKFADEYYVLYLAILIVLFIIRSVQVVRSKPIKRCMKYFGV